MTAGHTEPLRRQLIVQTRPSSATTARKAGSRKTGCATGSPNPDLDRVPENEGGEGEPGSEPAGPPGQHHPENHLFGEGGDQDCDRSKGDEWRPFVGHGKLEQWFMLSQIDGDERENGKQQKGLPPVCRSRQGPDRLCCICENA